MATAMEVHGTATTAPAQPTPRPVPVAISPRPLADDEARIVTDLDELTEGAGCSCQAGDDQPY